LDIRKGASDVPWWRVRRLVASCGPSDELAASWCC
jgi:hypothetical protein